MAPKRDAKVVSIANDKGGAGKTTVTANLAASLAATGRKVMVADIDLSGALPLAFGLSDHPARDDGRGLVDAILASTKPAIVPGIRDNIDWLPGGGMIWELVVAAIRDGVHLPSLFAEMLDNFRTDYDFILLDCPPSNPPLQEMVLAGSGWLLVPAHPDPSNWDGLRRIGPIVKHVRRTSNPSLAWLGVLIFGVPVAGKRIMRVTRGYLDEAAGTVPVMETTIRYLATSGLLSQISGRLARELAEDRKIESKQIVSDLRRGVSSPVTADERIPASVDGLAADYDNLAKEVLAKIGSTR